MNTETYAAIAFGLIVMLSSSPRICDRSLLPLTAPTRHPFCDRSEMRRAAGRFNFESTGHALPPARLAFASVDTWKRGGSYPAARWLRGIVTVLPSRSEW